MLFGQKVNHEMKMTKYSEITRRISTEQSTWLITGVAGFIGSNLLEALLRLNQRVVGLDSFLTGYKQNLDEVQSSVLAEQWKNFSFIQGDIRDLAACRKACEGVEYVLHQAALGSVPRSMEDPIATNEHNLAGSLNMLVAARDARVKRFVYASSSSVYGDEPGLPKREDTIGNPLSPYAVTKQVNETYADLFARVFGLATIGLRYFNVFGPRQDPNGPYAAVIPKWFAGLLGGKEVYINGDGETSRDFCYVENVVQANILAACHENRNALNRVYNIAFGERTTLNELFEFIRGICAQSCPKANNVKPTYRDFLSGDIRHSLADINQARSLLGYSPEYSVGSGLEKAGAWYISKWIQ
jgi:UDP-N-acetylglucosamine/UDP-N-acetylgalactosamine 4-epimerase